VFGATMSQKRKSILIPTSGYVPAKESADLIINVAKRLDADVIAVHIRDPAHLVSVSTESEGWQALRFFEKKGREAGVKVTPYLDTGELIPSLKRFVEEYDIDMVLVGSSAGGTVAEWVTYELQANCEVPVLVVPQDLSELV